MTDTNIKKTESMSDLFAKLQQMPFDDLKYVCGAVDALGMKGSADSVQQEQTAS